MVYSRTCCCMAYLGKKTPLLLMIFGKSITIVCISVWNSPFLLNLNLFPVLCIFPFLARPKLKSIFWGSKRNKVIAFFNVLINLSKMRTYSNMSQISFSQIFFFLNHNKGSIYDYLCGPSNCYSFQSLFLWNLLVC